MSRRERRATRPKSTRAEKRAEAEAHNERRRVAEEQRRARQTLPGGGYVTSNLALMYLAAAAVRR